LVCDPAVISEILVEKADAFGRDPATRRSFKPVMGENSIFAAEGAEWRWRTDLPPPLSQERNRPHESFGAPASR